MYRGFNFIFPTGLEQTDYHKIGLELTKINETQVKEKLDSLMLKGGKLSGNEIIDEWFPEIKTHIFLSHSHKDRPEALFLAGILYEKFKIKTFIDSTVWGYSGQLLRQIDDEYCKSPNNKTYNYQKRNYSTSHVNLMLSSALNRMIDNCECIFFLNSPNSITSKDVIEKTDSPWIFSELNTTKIIRKKTPDRLKSGTLFFSKGGQLIEGRAKDLQIEYELELSHLTDLSIKNFYEWFKKSATSPFQALDNLYTILPIDDKFRK